MIIDGKNDERNNDQLDGGENDLSSVAVVGVGDVGLQAVEMVIEYGGPQISLVAVSRDAAKLDKSNAAHKMMIWPEADEEDKFLRSFAHDHKNKKGPAPDEDETSSQLREMLSGARLVVIIASDSDDAIGLSDVPTVARAARSLDAFVITVNITKFWTGSDEMPADLHTRNIDLVKRATDVLIFLPDKIREQALDGAMHIAVDIAANIFEPGCTTLSVDDIARSLKRALGSVAGIGIDDTAPQALRAAIDSSLCDREMQGATEALLCLTTGPDHSIEEINEAAELLGEELECARFAFGHTVDPTMKGCRALVIVGRFDDKRGRRADMRAQVIGRLDRIGYHFDSSEQDLIRFSVRLDCKLSSIELFMRFTNDGYTTIGVIPIQVIQDNRDEVMRLLTMINNNLRIGSFDFDLEDGNIGFRTYTCYEGMMILPDGVIDASFEVILSTVDDAGDMIADVMMGYVDAITAIQQHDEQ